MTDWLSYRPSDFLMFSPRTYARLFELVNEAWWPLHVPVLGAGLLGVVMVARGRGWLALGVGLSAAWLFCCAVFLHERYLPINLDVSYLLPPLLLLAALLPLLAWRARGGVPVGGVPVAAPTRHAAVVLAAWALLLHPLLAGQAWRQAEVIAFAPDPTAIATLAVLLALPRGPTRAWRGAAALAWLLVLAWLAFSAFMLATMESWNAAVLLLAAALALVMRRYST